MAMLQLSILDKMHTATFDTISASLHQEYPSKLRSIYVRFPKQLAETFGLYPNRLYRVKKYPYGLPDAGKAYYEAYSATSTQIGFERSKSDPCLFIRIILDKDIRTYCWIHVDDTFVASTHKEELERFQTQMSSYYPITAMRQLIWAYP